MSHSGTVRGRPAAAWSRLRACQLAEIWAAGAALVVVAELAIASIAGDRFEPSKAAAVIISMFCVPGLMLGLRRPRPKRIRLNPAA
jgi:hypothetical protein